MKIAIIGSRSIKKIDIENYLGDNVDEIVSGGAKGVDSIAADFAKSKGIKLVEFLPEYEKYGRAAPIKRNEQIVKYADECLAFWDGNSKGTGHTVRMFEKAGKNVTVVKVTKQDLITS